MQFPTAKQLNSATVETLLSLCEQIRLNWEQSREWLAWNAGIYHTTIGEPWKWSLSGPGHFGGQKLSYLRGYATGRAILANNFEAAIALNWIRPAIFMAHAQLYAANKKGTQSSDP